MHTSLLNTIQQGIKLYDFLIKDCLSSISYWEEQPNSEDKKVMLEKYRKLLEEHTLKKELLMNNKEDVNKFEDVINQAESILDTLIELLPKESLNILVNLVILAKKIQIILKGDNNGNN